MGKKLPGTAEERQAYAIWVAGQRKRANGQCVVCDTSFEGLKRRLYCSSACRVKAYRARRAQPTGQGK